MTAEISFDQREVELVLPFLLSESAKAIAKASFTTHEPRTIITSQPRTNNKKSALRHVEPQIMPGNRCTQSPNVVFGSTS